MTRAKAVAIWQDLRDAGYSATLSGSTAVSMSPPEHHSVSVQALALEAHQLESLLAIAREHDCTVRFSGSALHIVPPPERPAHAR